MLDDFRDDDTTEKDGEFLDEFRQRLNSQPLDSLEERKNDITRSQHIFLGTVLGVGLAGIVSWFILSPDYSSVQDAEIPVVRRPQAAIKVQPADPGGMEILNQDKTVYDIVEKKDSSDAKVENLLPPPEEPKLVLADTSADSSPQAAKEKEVETPAIAAPQVTADTSAKVANSADAKLQPETQTPKEEPKEEIKIEIKQPEPSVVASKLKAQAQKEQAIANGSWQIQLISSPNKSAMEKAWNDLSKKYAVLKGLPHEVETADLGSKGIFYRLKAGAFKERVEADKICNSIKSAGGSCLVKKK